MKYNPQIHNRKSIRLENYDYSMEGIYFITMCIKNRECILGNIFNSVDVGVGALDNPKIKLSKYGEIVRHHINKTNQIYSNIMITHYIIMPNHLHFIIFINGSSRAPTPTLANAKIPAIISMLKRFINKDCGFSIWQRNYYEHIIRNEKELYKTIQYIEYNPLNWKEDKYNK